MRILLEKERIIKPHEDREKEDKKDWNTKAPYKSQSMKSAENTGMESLAEDLPPGTEVAYSEAHTELVKTFTCYGTARSV